MPKAKILQKCSRLTFDAGGNPGHAQKGSLDYGLAAVWLTTQILTEIIGITTGIVLLLLSKIIFLLTPYIQVFENHKR